MSLLIIFSGALHSHPLGWEILLLLVEEIFEKKVQGAAMDMKYKEQTQIHTLELV